MKQLKDLPIGIQTFKNMRENNFVYIDKTEHAYRLASRIGFYFLSRPRRFGKSLMASTLRELFEGNRKLFKGLWIEDKWDWSKTNPVIHISFAQLKYKELGLTRVIEMAIKENAERLNIELTAEELEVGLFYLLKKTAKQYGQKVVILIDEYDKPIIDFLQKEQLPQAKINRDILKSFYSPLKDSEDLIRFLLITGVSKFSKVSIFSDLNHLDDITYDNDYATITGYTQEELETAFEDHIEATMAYLNVTREELLKDMKEWYNGFSWNGKDKLYNPFCILNFFSKKDFRNYWFSTATPTFLINLVRERGQYSFESLQINSLSLEKYDLENMQLTPLLLQTGYLTVKEKNFRTGELLLDYPNREVRQGMYEALLIDMSSNPSEAATGMTAKDLSEAFKNNDLDRVQMILNALFADLPYTLYENDPLSKIRAKEAGERFYHSIIHILFKYLGLYMQSEVNTSWGRADAVVTTQSHIYIFEFKFSKTGKAAFDQIIKKKYGDAYRVTGKTIIGVGVNFSPKIRRIHGWKVDKI